MIVLSSFDVDVGTGAEAGTNLQIIWNEEQNPLVGSWRTPNGNRS
jgi:hypothetical protein